jgi:hypothetical protein
VVFAPSNPLGVAKPTENTGAYINDQVGLRRVVGVGATLTTGPSANEPNAQL